MKIKLNESGLNSQELPISESLVSAWNNFSQLDIMNDSDKKDFIFHIHALQNILMSRIAFRDYPKYWGTSSG